MTLHLVPVRFRDARAFIAMWHRHNPPPAGMVFTMGVASEDRVLRGVAVAGRPVSRMLDNGQTLEVTRVAVDGSQNANSLLYGAAWRAAKALGYTRLITYSLTEVHGPVCGTPCHHVSCHWIRTGETGASLRAAGWRVLAQRPARGGWDCPSRPRVETRSERMPRTLWEAAS